MTDYFQRSYSGLAWEPAAPDATAMASIGPLQQQRRFAEARPLLETLLQLEHEHPEALYNLGVLASEEGKLRMPMPWPTRGWRWPWQLCGWATREKPARPW